MTNKEVSEKLQKLFLKQDPKVLAKFCANLIIDINRFMTIDQITEEEQRHLYDRTLLSLMNIYKYLKAEDEVDDKIELIEFNVPNI